MSEFLSENFQGLVVKFSVYLNRPVFVMLNFPAQQFYFWLFHGGISVAAPLRLVVLFSMKH